MTNLKRLLRINASMALTSLLLSNAFAGPFSFPEQADKLAKDIDQAFVELGVCKDIHECNRRELVYRSGTNDHQTVLIFQVHTIHPVAMGRAIQIATNAYYASERRVAVEIIGYRESREEKVRWFSGAKPVIQLAFKKDE